MSLINGISLKSKFALFIAGTIMISFFIVKTILLFRFNEYSEVTNWFEFLSIVFFIPPFLTVVLEFIELTKKEMIRREGMEMILNDSNLVSKADSKGIITYVNDKFVEVSKYDRDELIGQDHSLLNSGTHDKSFWTDME